MNFSSSTIFRDQQREIVQQWAIRSNALDLHIVPDERVCLEIYNALISDGFIEASATYNRNTVLPLNETMDRLSTLWLKAGYSAREVASIFFSLRQVLTDALEHSMSDRQELFLEFLKLHKVIDHLVILAIESLIQNREAVILRQVSEVTEMATPVIKVWDGILCLPLIGTVDSSRIDIIVESVLQSIAKTQYPILILDVSGVPTIDSAVANHFLKLMKAVDLMGGRCIISGIRPAIAQAVVNLGIDLSSVMTKATLASALKVAFNMLHLELKSTSHKI